MRGLWTCLIAGLCWLVITAPCWAQAQFGEETEPKSYVFCYAIVGLGIALGLIAICRPGRRSAEIRRTEG